MQRSRVESVNVKVQGDERAVKEFLNVIESVFYVFVKSKPLPNDKDMGVHVFLDLNPYLKKGETPTSAEAQQ